MSSKLYLKDGNLALKTEYVNVSKCRKIIGGKWDKKEKAWTYPVMSAFKILELFDNLEIDPEAEEKIKKTEYIETQINKLKKGEIEPSQHPFLMRHQRLCRDIASLTDSFAFYLDTGTGKTLTALQIIKDNPKVKWVVICPKTIIQTAWIEDQENYYPELKLLPLSRSIKKEDYLNMAKEWEVPTNKNMSIAELQEVLAPWAQVYIINPESFRKFRQFIEDNEVTGLIFDESVKIKDHKTQITKDVIDFSKRLDKKYLLSGEPAPNNRMEYFTQMKVVDEGVFGSSFHKFKHAFFEPVDFHGWNWRLKPDLEEVFADRLSKKAIFIDKHDCLDLPNKTYERRYVELTGDAAKHYKQMEKERFLQIEGSVTLAQNVLTSIMKLRQITSGFVIDSYEDTQPLHKQKLNELDDVLEEIGNKQVIIWCNFKNEIRTIKDMLENKDKTVVTAYSETKNTNDSIERFKNSEVQYMLAHPQTLKYGVTLDNCSYAIYYSLSYSFDDYYQSHDRIYRKGQEKPCTFIFILAQGTIDELIYQAIMEKKDISEAVKSYAKGVV